ncbi:hypothetical protein Trydic_g3701, partial [Trypoxylus dichotomus]
ERAQYRPPLRAPEVFNLSVSQRTPINVGLIVWEYKTVMAQPSQPFHVRDEKLKSMGDLLRAKKSGKRHSRKIRRVNEVYDSNDGYESEGDADVYWVSVLSSSDRTLLDKQ